MLTFSNCRSLHLPRPNRFLKSVGNLSFCVSVTLCPIVTILSCPMPL